ncbi:hypothetical protein [Nocardioides humi]|uniref:Uncharacterized protein n=1 Tax=Nocardioides humi TaxID=449461 RepID=A0ABN2B1E9_9ACTN|nr:hypothetical protein [Nocardioides humi]
MTRRRHAPEDDLQADPPLQAIPLTTRGHAHTPDNLHGLGALAGNRAISTLLGGRAAGPVLQRAGEVDSIANEGAMELSKTNWPTKVELQIGNDRDMSIAESLLRQLREDQPKIVKGVAAASIHQDFSVSNLGNRLVGRDNPLAMAIPMEAVGINASLITDLELYLAHAGPQNTALSNFKGHYSSLMFQEARLEAVAQQFAGTSLKDVTDEAGTAGVVENAVGASGNATEDLRQTYEQLQSDPRVADAQRALQAATGKYEALAPALAGASASRTKTATTRNTAAVTTRNTKTAVEAMQAKAKFEAAKKKLDEVDKAAEALAGIGGAGSEAAVKALGGPEAAAGVIGGLTELGLGKGGDPLKDLSSDQLKLLGVGAKGVKAAITGAGKGGPHGAVVEVVKTLVVEPAKEAGKDILAKMNAAYGYVDEATQAEQDAKAQGAVQEAGTLDAYKAALNTERNATTAYVDANNNYCEQLLSVAGTKAAATEAFTMLSDAIMAAAAARGKGGQGKALTEMLSFLREVEAFVVQANLVIETGERELTEHPEQAAASGEEDPSGMTAERKALQKWDGRYHYVVHEFQATNYKGERQTHYGAQQVWFSIRSFDMGMTEAEASGIGSVDRGPNSVRSVVPDILTKVRVQRARAESLRAQIMTRVFGG